MKKYKIKYTLQGHGEVIIEAKDEKEAEDKFYTLFVVVGAPSNVDYIEENQWEGQCIVEKTEEVEYERDREKEDALREANRNLI